MNTLSAAYPTSYYSAPALRFGATHILSNELDALQQLEAAAGNPHRRDIEDIRDIYVPRQHQRYRKTLESFRVETLRSARELSSYLSQSLLGRLERPQDDNLPPELHEAVARLRALFPPVRADAPEQAYPDLQKVIEGLQVLRPFEDRHRLEELHIPTPIRLMVEHTGSTLRSLKGLLSSLKAVSDMNRLVADNVFRDRVYYASPPVLEGLMERKWQTDVADLVVIGAGPAGLSTALHATRQGLKTLVVDGGFALQSFSDQFMSPVHVMRTSAGPSSLTNPATSPEGMHDEHGMPRHLAKYRKQGAAARQAYAEQTGKTFIGDLPRETDPNPNIPVARNELFQYFEEILETVAESKNGIVLEQAKIIPPTEKRGGLFRLVTDRGHVIRARNVVMATGFVGDNAQCSRENEVFEQAAQDRPDRVLLLKDCSELDEKCEQLAGWQGPGTLIHDPMLGSPETRRMIQALPAQTHHLVVGGGESGAKGVMELFNLRPDIEVHWVVHRLIESDQLQVPASNTDPDRMMRCIQEPAVARESLREWLEDFGVPVTPETVNNLTQKARQGRLHVHVRPGKINAENTRLDFSDKGKMKVMVKDSGETAWKPLKNIDGESVEIGGVLVSAIGYDRKALREQDTLLQDWLGQGLVEYSRAPQSFMRYELALGQNGLSSALEPGLYPVGPCNLASAADSAIFGMPVRAAEIVKDILKRKQGSSLSD